MGAWAYCRQCENGLAKPTPREVIEGIQMCSSGHQNEPVMSRDELLLELVERVEALEAASEVKA